METQRVQITFCRPNPMIYGDIVADLSTTNTRIYNSARIYSRDSMKIVLQELRNSANSWNYAICKMSVSKLIHEWRVHNLFYKLHLFRSHTHDVDLNLNKPWFADMMYAALSPLYSLVASEKDALIT